MNNRCRIVKVSMAHSENTMSCCISILQRRVELGNSDVKCEPTIANGSRMVMLHCQHILKAINTRASLIHFVPNLTALKTTGLILWKEISTECSLHSFIGRDQLNPDAGNKCAAATFNNIVQYNIIQYNR